MIKVNRSKKTGLKIGRINSESEQKKFAHLTVKHWLKNNAHRFTNPPRITNVRKSGFTLKFRGITPQIVVSIKCVGALEVWVSDDKGNWWDILTDFDLGVAQNHAGQYYCDHCEAEYRDFFSSKRELWEQHSLEPMLEWANENLRSDHWLCLFGKQNGSTWAKLVNTDKLQECRHDERFYAAYPLEVKQNNERSRQVSCS